MNTPWSSDERWLSMFKELTNYLDKDFYEAHKVIHFDTLNREYGWEVFAVFETDIVLMLSTCAIKKNKWFVVMARLK